MRSLYSVIDILFSSRHAASHRELMLILDPDVTSRPNCDERGLVRVRTQSGSLYYGHESALVKRSISLKSASSVTERGRGLWRVINSLSKLLYK